MSICDRESWLWNDLKKMKFEYVERIEAKNTGSGFPDTHLVLKRDGPSWFVELKRCKIVNGKFVLLSALRPAQIRWHMRFSRASSRSCFLLGISGNGIRDKYIVSSRNVIKLYRKELMVAYGVKCLNWNERDFSWDMIEAARLGDLLPTGAE